MKQTPRPSVWISKVLDCKYWWTEKDVMQAKIQGRKHHILMELFLGCRADNKLHNLSDSETAHQIRHRFNFSAFWIYNLRLCLQSKKQDEGIKLKADSSQSMR
ncbi:MAG: hypothetical protein ACXWAT_10745 [Methylobacter sp.]